jgi:hypothetical protein
MKQPTKSIDKSKITSSLPETFSERLYKSEEIYSSNKLSLFPLLAAGKPPLGREGAEMQLENFIKLPLDLSSGTLNFAPNRPKSDFIRPATMWGYR